MASSRRSRIPVARRRRHSRSRSPRVATRSPSRRRSRSRRDIAAMPMACLDDLTITNLVGNALADPDRGAALAHLDECATCYELVAAIGSPRGAREAPRIAPGTKVGRYVVDGIAGAGAMGVVYEATDPELDRRVALKCIAGPGDPQARERMIREVKAMARVSHRNVVTVFDV